MYKFSKKQKLSMTKLGYDSWYYPEEPGEQKTLRSLVNVGLIDTDDDPKGMYSYRLLPSRRRDMEVVNVFGVPTQVLDKVRDEFCDIKGTGKSMYLLVPCEQVTDIEIAINYEAHKHAQRKYKRSLLTPAQTKLLRTMKGEIESSYGFDLIAFGSSDWRCRGSVLNVVKELQRKGYVAAYGFPVVLFSVLSIKRDK